jgi:hypothetical protein
MDLGFIYGITSFITVKLRHPKVPLYSTRLTSPTPMASEISGMGKTKGNTSLDMQEII